MSPEQSTTKSYARGRALPALVRGDRPGPADGGRPAWAVRALAAAHAIVRRLRFPDHPHGRGEECIRSYNRLYGVGSPPRAWGGEVSPPLTSGERRITPTGVGRSLERRGPHVRFPDHPHGRGEESCAITARKVDDGSPLSRAIEMCPVTVTVPARWWPPDLPGGGHRSGPGPGLGQGFHPLAGEGLGEADAFAAGLAEVGVVQEPVDGRGREGLGHDLVEAGGV